MNESWSAVREIAVSRTDADRIDLLALLDRTCGGATATDLVEQHGGSRETVYRRLQEFEALGFVVDEPGGEFRATRSGVRAMQAYERVSTRLDECRIAYLANSHYRRELILALEAESADKAALAADEQLPSRATVHRTLDAFDEFGWLVRTGDGRFEVAESAVIAVEQFEWLLTAFEAAITKGPALQVMAYWADPPLHALEGSDLVAVTESDPHALLNAAVEAAGLRSDGFERLQTVLPLFDPVLYDLFGEHLDETTQQIIFDQPTYRQLTQPDHIHYFGSALLTPGISVRIHPDPLYTGLSIFNDETVLVGGSTRQQRDAAVVGDGAHLHRWATETFDELWAESQRPSDRVRDWLSRATRSQLVE